MKNKEIRLTSDKKYVNIFTKGNYVTNINKDLVILITKETPVSSFVSFSGVVVKNNTVHPIGEHRDDWVPESFIQFSDEINTVVD